MRRQILRITTAADGSATVTGSAVLGKLYGILYSPGTIATGGDLTITCEGDVSHTLLVKANAGTSATWYYPRELQHNPTDGAALTGTAGGDRTCPIVDGTFKVVVAEGGNGGVGSVTFYYE